MNSISKISLGIAAGVAVAQFVGGWKVVLLALVVAGGTYLWDRYIL